MKNNNVESKTINQKKIEKVELNYISATKHTPPVTTIPISSSHMEMLDESIKEKVKQNQVQPHDIYY